MGRKNKKQDKRWHRRHNTIEVDTSILPDPIDLPKSSINPRWSKSLLRMVTPIFREYRREAFSDPSDYFQTEWDRFADRLWMALIDLENDALRRSAYEHYMQSLATNTWQETNSCWDSPPPEYVIDFAYTEEVWQRLVGDERAHYVWQDQLDWTCQFLDLNMP